MSPHGKKKIHFTADDPLLQGARDLTDGEKKGWKRETKSHADRKHGGDPKVEDELNGYMGVAESKKGWWKK